LSYVGTTETGFEGPPDTVSASVEDVVYLLRSANAVFPDARLQPDDVIATWAGVRPLVRPPNGQSAGAASREHVITERPGMISIVGGKLTTYRRMARDVVDHAAAALHAFDGRALASRPPTDREPLPGGETADLDAIAIETEQEGLAAPVARRLVRRYGSEAPAIARRAAADPALAQPVAPGGSAIGAELLHAVQREMVVTLCDLLVRRTHVFYETPGHGVEQAAAIAALVAPELGWDAPRCRSEVDAYRAYVAREEMFRAHLA
jgi:glycerol-3-phosphate dehydrogenase